MEEMIAFCGLPRMWSIIGDKNNDDEKRAEVARLWTKLFKVEIKPEDINCDGCLSEGGRLFSHCNVCEIRRCGMEKGVTNCAYYNEYPCKKFDFIFRAAPNSKKQLDKIKSRR